ncbi:hypothetical protein Tco_1526046 [Tanacetum coccineum]
MDEDGHEEGGKRDTVVSVIKETGVHSNFTGRSLMHGGIGAGQLRMDLLGDKIFSTNGIKNIITSLALVQDQAFKSFGGPTRQRTSTPR